MIDPDKFLEQGVDGALDDHFVPVDADTDEGYEAIIDEIKPRISTSRNGDLFATLDIFWAITDPVKLPVQQAKTGQQKPRVKQGLFLDAELGKDEDDNNVILSLQTGPGKNIQLGQLRTALGQNDQKKRWSFRNLIGAQARVLVEHIPDKNDPENIYAQVMKKGVVAL